MFDFFNKKKIQKLEDKIEEKNQRIVELVSNLSRLERILFIFEESSGIPLKEMGESSASNMGKIIKRLMAEVPPQTNLLKKANNLSDFA